MGSRRGSHSCRLPRLRKQARLRNRRRRARLLAEIKKPGQRVQAVELHQTDRFGSPLPERNPISAVWQKGDRQRMVVVAQRWDQAHR